MRRGRRFAIRRRNSTLIVAQVDWTLNAVEVDCDSRAKQSGFHVDEPSRDADAGRWKTDSWTPSLTVEKKEDQYAQKASSGHSLPSARHSAPSVVHVACGCPPPLACCDGGEPAVPWSMFWLLLGIVMLSQRTELHRPRFRACPHDQPKPASSSGVPRCIRPDARRRPGLGSAPCGLAGGQ